MGGYDDMAAAEAVRLKSTTAPVAVDDTYDTMAAQEAERRGNVLRASLNVATQVNPDAAGKVQTLADKTGLPAPVIERNTDLVTQQQKARELYQAMQDSPILARQMSDPTFAKIAQDDTANLTTFEKVVRFPWKVTQAVASGLPSLAGGIYGALAAPFELSAQITGTGPNALAGSIGRDLRERSASLAKYGERVGDTPADAGMIQRSVMSGFQSIGMNLPSLVTALYTGNTALALSVMSAAAGGQSYTKGREAGLTPFTAARYGVADAGFEYLTEIMPMTRLIGDMKAGAPFIKTLMHNQVSEQLGEQAATVLQDFNEWATLHPEKPFSAYLAERPSAALQTAIATAIGSGGQVVIAHAAQSGEMRAMAAEHAKADSDALKQLLQTAAASKLRERSPATFTQFVNAAAADGPVDAVYVNAQMFAQSAAEAGIDIKTTMPETAAALDDALATKTDVRIPLGEFAAAVSGTELEQSMIPHLRTSRDGPTQLEASDKQWVEETKAQTEKILAEHEFTSQWKQSLETVRQELLTQLKTANRFTQDVNDAYAGFMASFYATQAHRLGITPEQMYVKYPLQIRAQNVAGKGVTMGQGDLTEPQVNAFAEDLKQRHGVDTLDLHVEKNGDIKLDTIATATTNTGAGSKAMQDVIDFADKHGRRITLSLAEKGYQPIEGGPKTTSPERLRAFYKRFGFVDNKGRGKDFTLSASMYRKPQQALEQPAYHGSPHDIGPEGFSTDKIGTGEGAQAYGWGLYFAENPSIAAGYYRQLADNPAIAEMKLGSRRIGQRNNFDYSPRDNSTLENVMGTLAESLLINENMLHAVGVDGFQAHVLKELDELIARYKTEWPEGVTAAETLRKMLARPGAVSIKFDKSTGGVYQVDIPDDAVAKMLLWDKPLSEQVPGVRKALKELLPQGDDAAHERALISAKVQELQAEFEANGEHPTTSLHVLAQLELVREKQAELDAVDMAKDPQRWNALSGELHQLRAFGKARIEMTGEQAYRTLEEIYNSDEQASKVLAASGVPGIKYLDAGSRGQAYTVNLSTSKGAYSSNVFDSQNAADHYAESKRAEGFTAEVVEDGTHNIVVFDDKIIKLTHKDGSPVTAAERTEFLQPAQTGARGNITFAKDIKQNASIITLLEKADLSTFLHESGHFYLEVLTDMAQQPEAPAEIVADLNHLLKWFGVSPEIWPTLSLEERRPYHEQFARGFEAYLFEGKAPTTELNALFARFRAWMLNVYKQLTALNVELTPEVRTVMDRMLATNDEIVQAENMRSMAPLLETKPEGVSDAEWLEYQALGTDATQEAVDQLQTRSLRDMKYARNAHSKVVRDLQRQAAVVRRGVRVDARREILSEPIYQAWQFLTAKPEQFDKKKVEYSDTINTATDSLFTAMAKAGGVNRAEAVRRWGIDPADIKGMPHEGTRKSPFPVKGGISIDAMLERLAQYGYFDLDANGKADERQFEDKVGEERSDNPQYSSAADFGTVYASHVGPQSEAETIDMENDPAGRLDTESLKGRYGAAEDAQWRKLTNLGMTNAENGLSPDTVAELFGFSSGDELVKKLLTTEPPRMAIEGLTDQYMLERYGDLSDPAAIAKAADQAVHNDVRARFVATEMHMLDEAMNVRADTGQKDAKGRKVTQAIIPKAAREFAEAIVARKKIRDIKPNQYSAAETRAAKAAERAIAKSDIATAAAEKRTQLVNLYATKAAYNAVDEVEKGVGYLKRVGESKTIDPEYREQINALLERFDLRVVSNKEAARRATLVQWIESQRDKGYEPVIPESLLDEAQRKPYREMPLEEFRGLVDAVRNIEHLGRLKHKLLTLQDQREFAAVVEELVGSIEEHAKRTVPVKLERNTWLDKMKDGATEFFAMHRKFAFMGREMDGHADNGVFWNLLVKPMNAAGDTEALMREEATIKLQALFEPLLKAGKLREKLFIPEINGSLSREGRIMVALNTGNEGNLQRLMDGDHWTMPQVQAVVDTLTKPEMEFVQSVWDFVGSYRQQIGEQQKKLTGIEPEWVEARTVLTPHGEFAGGYLPAKYDTTRSTRSLGDEAAAGIMDQWRAARGISKARDSFTKGRADKVVNRPLRKDFGVITQHVTEVTHRLAWQEYLTDATRLLRASAVDNAIRDHYGPEVLKALRDTIEDVAAGEVGAQNAFERGLNHLRTGATIAGLGWRITTSLLQPIGLTQSMVRIGPKWVVQGMVEWLGDAAKMENTAARIFEKSDMMRLRAKTMQREISEIRNQVSGKSSAIEASYFYLIQKMQLVADIPTWLGQYHKAVAGGADETNAVAQADQAVLDAQGGGQIKDLAAIQRGGPMLKLFTNFYSFFNTTYQLTHESVGRTNFKNPLSVGRLAVDMLLLYSVPAALGTLLKAALHSGDDDDKKLIRQLIADQLTYLFGTVVGLREVAGGVQTALGLPGDYSGPASVRVFAEIAKLGKQAGQGEVDEALLKAADNVGGILFHYPAGQINATADGIATMARGKTSNPGALIVGSNK